MKSRLNPPGSRSVRVMVGGKPMIAIIPPRDPNAPVPVCPQWPVGARVRRVNTDGSLDPNFPVGTVTRANEYHELMMRDAVLVAWDGDPYGTGPSGHAADSLIRAEGEAIP